MMERYVFMGQAAIGSSVILHGIIAVVCAQDAWRKLRQAEALTGWRAVVAALLGIFAAMASGCAVLFAYLFLQYFIALIRL